MPVHCYFFSQDLWLSRAADYLLFIKMLWNVPVCLFSPLNLINSNFVLLHNVNVYVCLHTMYFYKHFAMLHIRYTLRYIFITILFHILLTQVERIIFCLFLPKDVELYEELMQVYFPVPKENSPREDEKGRWREHDFYLFLCGWLIYGLGIICKWLQRLVILWS